MDGPITRGAIQPPVPLVVFDFDGTLSPAEMNVLLGRRIGAEAEMADLTDRAMRGELRYPESLRSRVALLDGLSVEEVDRALEAVALRPGAADVLSALADAGVHTTILTGGFHRGVIAALDRAGVGVDRVVANRLVVADGALAGRVEGPLVDGTKDDVLIEVAQELDVSLADTVAVGDGANDRPLLETAGYAIGYDPKPAVEDVCDVTVTSMSELLAALHRRGVLPAEHVN